MTMINTDYIKNLNTRLEVVADCKDLAEIKKQVEDYFKAQMDDLQKTIDALAILNVTDLDITKVVSWVQNFISANITGPYGKALVLQAELVAALALLVEKIDSINVNLKCDL